MPAHFERTPGRYLPYPAPPRSIRAEAHQVKEGLTRDLESAATTEAALRNRIRELEETLGSQIGESGEESAG